MDVDKKSLRFLCGESSRTNPFICFGTALPCFGRALAEGGGHLNINKNGLGGEVIETEKPEG